MKQIKFTPKQWEIVTDRPADCIAECLSESGLGYAFDQVNDRADTILRDQSRIDWGSGLDCDIVEDACTGSTFFCGIKHAVETGEVSRGAFLAGNKAANAITKATGWDIPRDR